MKGKPRILVVDDERLITTMLKDILEAHGYEVLVAYDGQEGLKRARTWRPDLIILDIMMPKLDGFKMARLLKGDRNFQHIPIIILTAKAGEQDALISKMSGADVYLVKPVEPKQLLEQITGLLGKA